MQATLFGLAAASACVAALASIAERRRTRRRAVHGPGWMPWPTLVVAGTFVALVLLGVALKG